jgi:hypothetical protein
MNKHEYIYIYIYIYIHLYQVLAPLAGQLLDQELILKNFKFDLEEKKALITETKSGIYLFFNWLLHRSYCLFLSYMPFLAGLHFTYGR